MRPQIPSLTGFRFLAAWFVVIGHTDGEIAALQWHNLEYGWRVLTNVGMTLFFVLSGFVIHYNYGASIATFQPRALWQFFVARFARLYPLYLFALVISVAQSGPEHMDIATFWHVLPRYLTMTQNWTDETVHGALLTTLYLGAAWSLSAEVFLYLFYILIALPIALLRRPTAVVGAMIVVGCIATIFFGGFAFSYWLTGLPTQQWWLALSPFSRIPEFLLGVLTAALFLTLPKDAKQHPVWPFIGAFGLLSIVGVFALSYWYQNVQAVWGFAPGIAAIILSFALRRNIFSALVEHPLAQRLGDASYSTYLLHGLLLYAIFIGNSETPMFELVRVVAAWTLIAFLSVGVYEYFEWPARRWLRQRLAPQQKRDHSVSTHFRTYNT